jgi:cellulose synthase/poly-beta-1,6-N-acetylglucosamine synthase-like glycosyltransferase
MLRALSLTAQGLLLGLAGYNAVIAIWGWPNQTPSSPGPPARRLRVVVPAHDEAQVIGALLGDLGGADYPEHLRSVGVIADRCTDDTAAIARAAGAVVAERTGGIGGKGAALAWYLSEFPLGGDEALVVFDADNRVPGDVLSRIASALDAGNPVVQCYLDVLDPDRSPLATASALSYWAGNRMVQLARSNLGWSCDLGGTGMAFTAEALDRAGGFSASLTEDQDLGARLSLEAVPVAWLHDVRIRDEKPAGVGAAVRQRARWMAGRRSTGRRYVPQLVRAAVARRRPELLDQALRLVQPGRSFVALLSGAFTVVALGTGSRWLFPWPLWGVATVVQVLEPIPFLARDGVERRHLIRYPFLILLAGLWAPIRVLSSGVRGWMRTEHSGDDQGTGRDAVRSR